MKQDQKEQRFDVAVIGAGVSGAAVAYALSRYQVHVLVLEKEPDIAMGTTKANSAIVHAGYDPIPGSKMARLNLQGSQQMGALCQALDVPYAQIGSLVLAFSKQEMETVQALYQRGLENGVSGMQVLTRDEVLQMEKQVSDKVCGALLAPSAAIVSPWGLAIAMLEIAVENGAKVMRKSRVTAMHQLSDGWELSINQGETTVHAGYVINCAGVGAAAISQLTGEPEFSITPVKGEYHLLDKSQGKMASHVLFQCPDERGKGILVSPTVGGNLIVGPTAQPQKDSEDLSTEQEGMQMVEEISRKTMPSLNFRENIRSFAGLRAKSNRNDFIIEPSAKVPRLIHVAGIASPGLSAAPAIGQEVVSILQNLGLELDEREAWIHTRRQVRFAGLSPEEKQRLVAQHPEYGEVICRCNTITKGEILQALHSPIPPTTLDGVKRRCGTAMGRCQGGFCTPKIHLLMQKELGIPVEKIELESEGSKLILEQSKEDLA